MELDRTIIHRLRTLALEGASASELLRAVARSLNPPPQYTSIFVMYLRAAFHLSPRGLTYLGGWSEDNTGEVSDETLNQVLMPEIEAKRPLWEEELRRGTSGHP